MPAPQQENHIFLTHFEKFSLRQGLSIMPETPEKAELSQILERAGTHDGRISLSPALAEYVCREMKSEINTSLTLAFDPQYDMLQRVMNWVYDKLEPVRGAQQ